MGKKTILAFTLAVILLPACAICMPGVEAVDQVKGMGEKTPPIIRPLITQVRQSFGGTPNTEVDIIGINFGDSQGGKRVYFDSFASSTTLMWSPTFITVVVPAGLTHGCEHVVSIRSDGLRISNEFKFMLLRVLEGTDPAEGAAGQTVTLYGFHLGTKQGGRRLMMGSTQVCTIASWANGQIVFKVPATIRPGTYELYLMEGAKIVSNKNNFRVIKPFLSPRA